MITSAISSAVDASAFFTTSSVIGSTLVSTDIDVDLDVAIGIEPCATAGRYDAGGVVLVNEQRARPLAVEQGRPRHHRNVQLADGAPEVRAPGALVARQALDRGYGVIAAADAALDPREHARGDDLHRVERRAVPVGAEVLGDEVVHEAVD